MGIKLPMAVLLAFSLTGCQQAYYNTMEKFGVHKREILVDRVEEARDSQIETQEQFKSALERFSEVVNFDGGDLEKQYEALNDEYDGNEKHTQQNGYYPTAFIHDTHVVALNRIFGWVIVHKVGRITEYKHVNYG